MLVSPVLFFKSSRKSKATTKNADAIRKVMTIHEAVEFEEKGKKFHII